MAKLNKPNKPWTQYTFYERIQFVLSELNIKQVRFYSDLYLSRQTVVSWKKGSIPASDTLLKVADYLKIDPHWLIFGKIEHNVSTDNVDSPLNQVKRICKVLEKKYFVTEENYFAPLQNCIREKQIEFWAIGISLPKIQELEVIADKLKVPVSYIINGSGYDLENDKEIKNHDSSIKEIEVFGWLDENKQKTVKDVITSLYVQQLYDREHRTNYDDYLTDKDPYDDPHSSFEAGMEN